MSVPTVMPFGKHEGRPLCAVPTHYLDWLVSREIARPPLRAHVEAELQRRREGEPDPQPPRTNAVDWETRFQEL